MAALPLLGVFFLKHLLKLVQFLAQLRERLLCGIGFLSAFLSGAEIRFFRSVFLKTMAIASIVHRVRAPMFLAQVAVFLGMYLFGGLWDYGQYQVASYLSSCCAKVSCREKRWVCWILPGHIRA